MFCPLCQAEYREGFEMCSTCGARLVAADADESERHPPRVVWVTADRKAADRVFAVLRDAQIACYESAKFDHWLYAVQRKRPEISLSILARDAPAAQQAAGVEFAAPTPQVPAPLLDASLPRQQCPACSFEFPAGDPRCPACGEDLLAWWPEEDAAPGGPPAADAGMPPQGTGDDGNPEIVWRGGDPVTFSRALEVLRENRIPHYAHQTSDHFAFAEAMPRPKLAIRVRARDSARALELVEEFQDSFPLVPQEPVGEEQFPEGVEGEAQSEQAVSENAITGPQFQERRVRLQWGAGLVLFSFLLMAWVARSAPLSWISMEEFLSPAQGQMRRAAVLVLIASGFVANLAALVFLYRSWLWKADKVGLLSLLFGFKGALLFFSYFFFFR